MPAAASTVRACRPAIVGREGADGSSAGDGPPPGVRIESRAASSSLAFCGRSAGRFSRQRMTSAASAGGAAGRRLRMDSGASATCAASVCWGVRRLPVRLVGVAA
jgi:hypothetical protein